MKKKLIYFSILLIVGVFVMDLLFYHQPRITHYEVHTNKIPEAFHGFTILQISDLHDATFGKSQRDLLHIIACAKPSIVVFTGDLIERRCEENKQGLVLMKELAKNYPLYYVTGNHEESLSNEEYQSLMESLQSVHVNILMNEGVVLTHNSSHLLLIGLRDALATPAADYTGIIESVSMQYDEDMFTILLAHRPEFFTQYVNAKVDIVLSGHTHGGQIRFPYIGGIYAPNQGFFPRYIEGEYRKNQTTMFVNRGLGATVLPFRLFNPPDISVIHLYHSTDGTDT